MALPSKPVRKSANVNTDSAGRVRGGDNNNSPTRKSAQPFGSVNRSVYKHPSAGITPGGVPINDKDAGRGTGNARSAARGKVPRMGSGTAMVD